MKVSLKLLLLAQTHHIRGILSSPRLYSMDRLRIIPHLADGRSKLVCFVLVVVHAGLGRWKRKSNGVSQTVGGMLII